MRQIILVPLVNFMIAATATGSALAEVRLSNDYPAGGYLSAYTIATGFPTPTRRSVNVQERAAVKTSLR